MPKALASTPSSLNCLQSQELWPTALRTTSPSGAVGLFTILETMGGLRGFEQLDL